MAVSSIPIAPGVRLRLIRSSWWLDVCRDYERHRVNLRTHDEGEARDEARRLVREVKAGRLSWAALFITVEKAVDDYIEYLKQKHRMPRTIENSKRMLSRYLEWLSRTNIRRLADIEQATLDKFLAWLANERTRTGKALSFETANGEVRRIAAMLSWATLRRRLIPSNPARGFEYLPVDQKVKRALRVDEIQKIIRVSNPLMRNIILTLANLGCRLMEALAITAADVDLEGNELTSQTGQPVPNVLIRASKTRTIRRIPLNEVMIEIFRRRKLAGGGPESRLFTTPNGKPVNRANVRRDFIAAAVRANVDPAGCTPHAVRRGFCTRLASSIPAAALGYLAGHADARTTNRYYRGSVAVVPPVVAG